MTLYAARRNRVGARHPVIVNRDTLPASQPPTLRPCGMDARSNALDDAVYQFLGEQLGRTVHEFSRDLTDLPRPIRLIWGSQPEYRPATTGRGGVLLMQEGSDWWQIRYQLGHEIFHWVCTPGRLFHWVHEMFAVEMSLRGMQAIGEHDYVREIRQRLASEATELAYREMQALSLEPPYPTGLYGRAWITGRDLQAAVGWNRLKPLAAMFRAGEPDMAGWFETLSPEERLQVTAVIGDPSSA